MFRRLYSVKIKTGDLLKHETKSHVLFKFSLVLSVFIIYFLFIAKKYGVQQGFMVSILTWSFFVLCTPVADAGFLIDFPLRLITNLKMLIAEGLVWLLAISLNIYVFFFNPNIYEKTKLLKLFKHILENPLPFWSIILISLIGTFVSIKFGDELLDKVQHRERKIYQKHKLNHQLITMIFLIAISLVLYDFLLKKLGINLPI